MDEQLTMVARLQKTCAECGGPFRFFPAPRVNHGAWCCSGECAMWRRRRIVGWTKEELAAEGADR